MLRKVLGIDSMYQGGRGAQEENSAPVGRSVLLLTLFRIANIWSSEKADSFFGFIIVFEISVDSATP